jgi:hypothetical protein
MKRLGKVFQNAFSVDELLRHESYSGKHGKTAVLELLGLKSSELSGIGGLQAKGVEANVTRAVVGTQEAGLVNRDITRGNPSVLGTVELDLGNANGENKPEGGRHLSKVADGRSLDGSIKEERRSLDLLANEESDGGQHGDASVGELGLTVTLKGVIVGLGGKAKGVEEPNRSKGPWDGVDVKGRL